jgi:hypothetical protein
MPPPVLIGLLEFAHGSVEENQNPMKKWRGRGTPAGGKEGSDFQKGEFLRGHKKPPHFEGRGG